MVWYSHLFQNFLQFIVIHTVKGFGIVHKTEIDVFLELFCFFDDPVDVGNFFFFKTRTQFFISSFLAFEVLLDDILGLRFFAIVLNHQTTAISHFTGFSLSVNFTEAYPLP